MVVPKLNLSTCRNLCFGAVVLCLVLMPAKSNNISFAPDQAGSATNSQSKSESFFTVRRDMRRCASPLCGGYFVRLVNQSLTRCSTGKYQSECYVTTIDWNSLPQVEPEKALLRATLVIKGDSHGKYGVLKVSESWRAVGTNTASGEFFRVRDRGLRCIAAPCLSHHEIKLNTTIGREIAGVDLSSAGADDQSTSEALAAMTGPDGVLVAGSHSPVTGPAGRAETLKASQFYVRVPSNR